MSSMDTRQQTTIIRSIAWLLTITVVGVAIAAWGQGLKWHVTGLSPYQIFPVFGLLAFSLMWTHYIVGTIRAYFNLPEVKAYFEATSALVLAALLAHPGLLVWQLWRDGFGLPPQSYLDHYVAPALGWVALLGTVSLFVFLAFELRRWYHERSWWKYILAANDLAMVAIFYHGLRLGSNLQVGWLPWIWYLYGVTLAGALLYKYRRAFGVK